jgi:hypothetical protein
MERSVMLSPTCSATVRLQRTKLRNEFELAHRTPQLNKHGVVRCAFFFMSLFYKHFVNKCKFSIYINSYRVVSLFTKRN